MADNLIPNYGKAKSFKELMDMPIGVATEEDILKSPLISEDTANYYRYGKGEDVGDLPELTEMTDLTDKLSRTPDKIRQETQQVEKAQAVESIISNLVKAFAAYGGLKSNVDMSGVDVKTGIDWKSILQGKVSALEEESRGLKETREITRQRLSDRIKSAQQGVRETQDTKHKEALTKFGAMTNYFDQQSKRQSDKEIADIKNKEEKGKEFKLKLGGFLNTAKTNINAASDEAKNNSKTLNYLTQGYDEDKLSLSDTSKIEEAYNLVAKTLGGDITGDQVRLLDKDQIKMIIPAIQKANEDKIQTANMVKNILNVAEVRGEQLSPELLNQISFLTENQNRLTASIPEGMVLLPIEGKKGTPQYAEEVKESINYLNKNPEAKTLFKIRSAIDKEVRGGWFSNPEDVKILQKFLDGEKDIDYANFPSHVLPGVLVPRFVKGTDYARSKPNAKIGIGKSK
jgi:hypothetical protein